MGKKICWFDLELNRPIRATKAGHELRTKHGYFPRLSTHGNIIFQTEMRGYVDRVVPQVNLVSIPERPDGEAKWHIQHFRRASLDAVNYRPKRAL